MKTFAFALTAAIVSFSTVGAYAGGFNNGGSTGVSSGLINISPSIGLGNIGLLNGIGNNNAILSGNVVSGILDGNKTNVLSDILGTVGVTGIGGNSYKLKKH